MVYRPLKLRPRIQTQKNGSLRQNYKKGGLRSVKSVQRLHEGKNMNKLYTSQPSPLPNKNITTSETRSKRSNNSKYSYVKSKVFDHLSPRNARNRLNSGSTTSKFDRSSQEFRYRSKSPSKSINDRIIWANLERDLINSIHFNGISEPMKF